MVLGWIAVGLSAQNKVTLDGFIKDSLTGEILIGANFTLPAISKGVLSNQYGFYSLTVAKGRYQLLCTYIGYQPKLIILYIADIIKKTFYSYPILK